MNIKNKPSKPSNSSKSKPKSNKSKPLKKTSKRTKGGRIVPPYGTIRAPELKNNEIELENRENGIYNFDDHEIHFFADLEGDIPEGIASLIYVAKPDDTDSKNIVNSKVISDKFIRTDLYTTKTVIVFTGDLIDRGSKSIRLLQDMIELKRLNYDNVIFTCGNRDINKIRFKKEFMVEYIRDELLKSDNRDKTIEELYDMFKGYYTKYSVDFKYKAKNKDIEEDIIEEDIVISGDNTPVAIIKKSDFDTFYKDDISRVWTIYNKTLGAPNQLNFFIEEFNILFKKENEEDLFKGKNIATEKIDNINDDTKNFYLFVAMMNIVMSTIYDDNYLPPCLVPFNGLYIKHLQNCHIMTKITIGNKLIFASHSGVPYDNGRFIFIKDIGMKNIDNNSMIDINIIIMNIIDINTNFYKFLKDNFIHNTIYFQQYVNGDKKFDKNAYKIYIAMSTGCSTDVKIDGKIYNKNYSPITTSGLLKDKGPLTYFNDGKDIKIFKPLPNLVSSNSVKPKENNYDTIYNIFGHQPSGVLPEITKVKNTYHIDLDISKTENAFGNTNKVSYVYLTITNKEDKLTGMSLLENLKNNLNKKEKSKDNDKKFIINKYREQVNNLPDKIDKYEILLDVYIGNTVAGFFSTDDNKFFSSQKELPFDFKFIKRKDGENKNDLIERMNLYEEKPSSVVEEVEEALSGAGIKKYKKSIKRFTNGKRKMVIYLGKRGGEYVKVKGRYISIIKYKKILLKEKKSKTSKK